MKNITFGNWHAEWLDESHGWVMDENGAYLAEIVTYDDEGRFLATPQEREAAAQLMAAAPRLLRALKRLRADPHAWLEADEAIGEAEGSGRTEGETRP
ncbi:MAG TPA: hypothetical protein VK661_01815 [Planctomycetota bacterium]|nr:hypothetical protein [Planctomycetota bacterium]